MYSFVFGMTLSAIILVNLLSLSVSQIILDIENVPVIIGEPYYLLEVNSWRDLSYYQKDDVCPLYVTQGVGSPGGLRGTPVKFSNPGEDIIFGYDLIGISFVADSSRTTPVPCEGDGSSSLGWKSTTDDSSGLTYITTGAVAGGDGVTFSIDPENHYANAPYFLYSCISKYRCDKIGFLEDGLLGINIPPVKVRFVRASGSLNNFAKASL